MQSSTASRSRLDTLLPAALLVGGSVLFLGAGGRHPRIGAALGPVGSDAFFQSFAREIAHVPNWEAMHAMILSGPLLWALGAAGVARLLPARVAALGEVGRAALLLAAAAWRLACVLDGFVAPVFARTIAAASTPSELHAAIAPFRTNQLTMARLGMVSMVLMGGATTAFALALVASSRRAPWRAVVGATGLLVGFWPMIAAARGEFAPGPFTSPYWTVTALATGAWFAMLATVLPRLARDATTLVSPAAHLAGPELDVAGPDRAPSSA
jgi:hypothetical protein